MIKQQVYVAGVSTLVAQKDLTRKVIGQDEQGQDIYGDYYKYYNSDMTVDMVEEDKVDKTQALAYWKTARQAKVDNIEVLYNEVIYQGDETSQARMSRSINALPNDTATIPWTAKDNSTHMLTKVDLASILLDAGTQQSMVWNDGRPA